MGARPAWPEGDGERRTQRAQQGPHPSASAWGRMTVGFRPPVVGHSMNLHHSSSKDDEDVADTSLEEKNLMNNT